MVFRGKEIGKGRERETERERGELEIPYIFFFKIILLLPPSGWLYFIRGVVYSFNK